MGIFVAMLQQCYGPDTVKMGSCYIEKAKKMRFVGFFVDVMGWLRLVGCLKI